MGPARTVSSRLVVYFLQSGFDLWSLTREPHNSRRLVNVARTIKISQPVQSATGVEQPLSADIDARTKRYAIQMLIRAACFLLAILTPHPWLWFFIAGAVILPYVAVIGANTPTKNSSAGLVSPALLGITDHRANPNLSSSGTPLPDATPSEEPDPDDR